MVKEKSSYTGLQIPVTNFKLLVVVSMVLIGGFLFFIITSPTRISSGAADKFNFTTAYQSSNSTRPDNKLKTQPNPPQPVCDFTSHRADNCDMKGEIRIHGSTSQVFIITDQVDSQEQKKTWIVRPYTRKLDKNILLIREVSVKIVSKTIAPPCQVNHSVPAVIFSNKGYCGNYWHDFNDILVPLFITARQFNGEVHFLVTQMKRWWFKKYSNYFHGLSKFDIINLDNMDAMHCFPRAIVGLHSHKDFSINPARAPNGYSMQDFTKFLRAVYSLERDTAMKLWENPGKKPRLYIIPRKYKRMLTNMKEIVHMAEELGFEVVIEGSRKYKSIKDAAQVINSCDVMMGVHGAGLTNMVFLPTNAVVIQIIPLGKLDPLFHNEFGVPAIDMKLKYISYNITDDESTLLNMYRRDDPIFTDPMSFHKQGWDTVAKIYLKNQNVKLDVTRFRPILQKAIKHLSVEPDS